MARGPFINFFALTKKEMAENILDLREALETLCQEINRSGRDLLRRDPDLWKAYQLALETLKRKSLK